MLKTTLGTFYVLYLCWLLSHPIITIIIIAVTGFLIRTPRPKVTLLTQRREIIANELEGEILPRFHRQPGQSVKQTMLESKNQFSLLEGYIISYIYYCILLCC